MSGAADQHSQRARTLTAQYMAGRPESFEAFRELVHLLLSLTIMAPNEHVKLAVPPSGEKDRRVLGGRGGPTDPVRLRDKRWLRIAQTLHLAPHENGSKRLKVEKSSIQYQANPTEDEDGRLREIFRYDYLREDPTKYPNAHINIYATLTEQEALAKDLKGRGLDEMHFPTSRISLEAILRMLIVDFNVPTAQPPEVWQPVFAASEAEFEKIAHRPGPTAA